MDAPVTTVGKRRGRKPKEVATELPVMSEMVSSDAASAEWDGPPVLLPFERKAYVGARVIYWSKDIGEKLRPHPADLLEQTPGFEGWNMNVQVFNGMFGAREVQYCGSDVKDSHWCWPDEVPVVVV